MIKTAIKHFLNHMKKLSTVLWNLYLQYKLQLHKISWFSSVRWSNMAQINTQHNQSDLQTVQTLCDKSMVLFTLYKCYSLSLFLQFSCKK